MNVKSLLLLLAFSGLAAGCSNDDLGTEGGGTTGPVTRSEIQIESKGSGDSQEYPNTKAIASENENEIKTLDVYLFAAAADGGSYYYLEKWTEGTAYNPEAPADLNFKKQGAGTGWKASIYPNEKKGLPYIKLLCVANNNVAGSAVVDGKFYQEDGATELFAALTPVEVDADGAVTNAAAATTVEDFMKTFTKAIDVNVVTTPLLMTGLGQTKISGSVSKVVIDLRRVVARFDIDNNTNTSQLTIQKLTMAHGRKTGALWGSASAKEPDMSANPLVYLTDYTPIDFTKVPLANQGVASSALYVYPTLATDESYLIIEGTYKSPVTSQQVPVTYHVPIVRTPAGGTKGEYIPIKANNRYQLHITDVTQSNVFGTFDVEDWTSGGGMLIKPDNDSPVFAGAEAFVDGDKPVALTDADGKVYGYEVKTDADGNGTTTVEIAATGHVRAEKSEVTKAAGTDWLTVTGQTPVEKDGVWYTQFVLTYADAIGKQPVAVNFINESASYDPALWTTINFYGPKAVPSFALVADGNSKGNLTALTNNDAKKPIASIYNVNGSYVQFDITSIEGVTPGTLAGYNVEKVKTEGFVHTYKISVADATTAAGGDLVFKNAGDETKTTTLTITKLDPSLVVTKTTDANSAGDYVAGSETPFVTTGTLQIDLDLLATGTCSFKVAAPQGATVASLNCPWLTITETHAWTEAEPWLEYSAAKKASETTADFDMVFTNGLTEAGITAPGFTLTLNKAFSKPQILPNIDPGTYANSAFNKKTPAGYPYAVTAEMYKVVNSTIYLQIDCPESMTVTSSDANVTATKQGDTKYYKIEVTNVAAADEVTITATNDSDANRKATITLTLVDPAAKIENPGGALAPVLSGTTVTIPAAYAAYSVSTFDIVAPEGSTVTCAASTWFGKPADATIPAAGKTTITLMGTSPQPADTPDVTITVHNSVTNADETITITKEVAAP